MLIEQNKDLNQLVQELSKKNPDPKFIKDKTNLLGIPYSQDLIILMSEVLVFISQANEKKASLKEKTI